MTDDIIDRLREWEWDVRMSRIDPDDIGDIIGNCVELIEKLREDRDRWKTMACCQSISWCDCIEKCDMENHDE
jgi:hypothetical protein